LGTSRVLHRHEAQPHAAHLMSAIRAPRGHVTRTALVALTGCALSVLAWTATAAWEDRSAEATFNANTANHVAYLQQGFMGFRDVMRAYDGFLEGTAGAIDRRRLDGYASRLMREYPGTIGLAWVPRVSPAERSHFEAQARRDGLPGYRIAGLPTSADFVAPAKPHEYYPVLYATPRKGDRSLLGRDLASEPIRRATLEQARDSGDLAVSERLPSLLRAHESGYIAVHAIYAGGARPASARDRRLNLLGFASGAFRLGQVVDGIIARFTTPAGLHVYVYRNDAAPDELPLSIHTSRTTNVAAPRLRLAAILARRHASGTLTFGQRSWLVVLIPVREPLLGLWQPVPLAVLGVGLLFCFVVVSNARHAARQRQKEIALAFEARAATERLVTTFDAVNDGIFLSDPRTGSFVEVNAAGCDMFGYTRAEIEHCTIVTLSSGVPPYDEAALMEVFAKALSGRSQTFEWHVKRKDGTLFWVEISFRIASFSTDRFGFAVLRDITARKLATEQLDYLAHYDHLTGLANRRAFVQALDRTIAAARQGTRFAVLYLDLDHFKDINDTLGHPVGDRVLQAVAERLRASVRAGDTVARFGGDEFAVILADIQELADAAAVSDRILDLTRAAIPIETAACAVADSIVRAIGEPYFVQGNEIRSGATIGIAVYGADSPDVETVLSHADVALYRGKAEGRGSYRFFTDAMDVAVRARVSMNDDLRRAIASDQLVLFYQPQVDVDTGRIVGLEALVRWNHPTRGIIGPGEFIPAAEVNGLIVSLGDWVLRKACLQTKEWLDAGIAPPLVAVNLSGVQFKTPVILERTIARVLAESGLPAGLLELELTESVLMEASHENSDVLLRLRQAGHRIAIDDFGSGFSSLGYLRRYPVDRIKIAQSFTLGVGETSGNDAIVKAALGLAHELGLEVVVEGVETAAELDLLKPWGCHIVQGFYFAKPLPVPEVTALLRVGKIIPEGKDAIATLT
jgi:diguanylate cyclase (GGDEF)-like protein/PAS domain S-box-containing protein